jgi:hypothetical protein
MLDFVYGMSYYFVKTAQHRDGHESQEQEKYGKTQAALKFWRQRAREDKRPKQDHPLAV